MRAPQPHNWVVHMLDDKRCCSTDSEHHGVAIRNAAGSQVRSGSQEGYEGGEMIERTSSDVVP